MNDQTISQAREYLLALSILTITQASQQASDYSLFVANKLNSFAQYALGKEEIHQ
ncbi:hypothetical protein Pcaca02_32350 [Pectobacterium carotovorum subsp. carotovorum]|nr:hypothetical protein Pcaca02_32350 [Pectobacterium carotovorum subsp. carotovorum]